jgi:hypothetical protein
MIRYSIDGKDFYNPFLAFLHGAHHSPHETPIFAFHDEVFGKIDWTQEPAESLTELIDSRARQISQKYKRIVLAFSGGTDSITVYNSFVRQNIFIDEIIISFTPNSEAHSIKNVSWIMKNHNDKRTKITVLDRNQSEYYTLYDNKEWVLQNYGQFRRFELGAPGPYFYRHCHDSWGNENWCMVIGYEKPHILRDNNNWFAVHLDKVFHPGLYWPRLEFFFITPDLPNLHIKQNHSLLKYIKKKFSNFHEGWSSVTLGKNSPADYTEYAEACGCDSEVNVGQGWIQKQNNSKVIKDVSCLMNNKFDNMIDMDPLLQEKLLQKDTTAVSFVQGWQSLQNDKTLVNYMLRQGLLSNTNQTIENYNGMWGKKYLLQK